MMTDPIADMLTRIRNAQVVRKASVSIPYSKLKFAIATLLKDEGYIDSVDTDVDGQKMLVLGLKYAGKKPYIQSITRSSKPGHRQYRKAEELPHVLNGYGIAIISTSKGVMSDKQARAEGIGGEVLCTVY
jgi:small subunit ribosomal protein S8